MGDLMIIRADSTHPDFVSLVKLLDNDLAIRDGEEHSFYAQFNKIDAIRYAAIAYHQGRAIGCGAVKVYSADAMEIKRMYVLPEARNGGVATAILQELEKWTDELGFVRCILETGMKQPEAIALYKRNGYHSIPNYGQYAGVANSICFEKIFKARS